MALLAVLAVAAAAPGVARASQERRLGEAASVLAGAPVTVRCQSLGQAVLDGGPELGYVRWRPDGSPEPWTLIKRDQCRHLAGYLRSDKRRPDRDRVVAVHVLTHEAMHLSGRLGEGGPSARPSSATPAPPGCWARPTPTPPGWPPPTGTTCIR